jgi:hypothetical protein
VSWRGGANSGVPLTKLHSAASVTLSNYCNFNRSVPLYGRARAKRGPLLSDRWDKRWPSSSTTKSATPARSSLPGARQVEGVGAAGLSQGGQDADGPRDCQGGEPVVPPPIRVGQLRDSIRSLAVAQRIPRPPFFHALCDRRRSWTAGSMFTRRTSGTTSTSSGTTA